MRVGRLQESPRPGAFCTSRSFLPERTLLRRASLRVVRHWASCAAFACGAQRRNVVCCRKLLPVNNLGEWFGVDLSW